MWAEVDAEVEVAMSSFIDMIYIYFYSHVKWIAIAKVVIEYVCVVARVVQCVRMVACGGLLYTYALI